MAGGKGDPKESRAVLTEGHIGRTLFRLTLPMTAGILGMVVFNLTDTFFVSRLGTAHLAALSFTFPVVLVLTRFALGLGVGAASVVSRAIGMGDWKFVRRLTTDGLALAVSFVLVFVIAGSLTIEKVFGALGAEGEILGLVKEYMSIWYWGLLFVVFPMVSNNAIRATGDTRTPAAIMLVGASVNLILDPLLIFGLGPFPRMEIAGAALATVIARMTTFGVSFYVIYRRLGMITFEKPCPREVLESWKSILFIALPAAATRVILPLGQGVVTGITATYGAAAVAALGVSLRIEIFAVAVVMALSSVLAPFTGQNWGAGRFGRMREGIRVGRKFGILWGLGSMVVLAVFARPVASLFSDDPDVISKIMLYLRIVPAAYFMQNVMLLITGVLNVLNRPLHAAAVGIGQVFVLTVPLAWLGSRLLGVAGIFLGIAVSYLVTGFVSQRVLASQLSAVENEDREDMKVIGGRDACSE